MIANLGHTAKVHGFSEEVGSIKRVPIIDALILYECLYKGKIFILVGRNVLYVPSMEHNLIPPFVLRQAGLVVNDKTKINCDRPTEDHHAIIHSKSGLHIRLQLDGVFSVFQTRKPNLDEFLDDDAIIVNITPEGTRQTTSRETEPRNYDGRL